MHFGVNKVLSQATCRNVRLDEVNLTTSARGYNYFRGKIGQLFINIPIYLQKALWEPLGKSEKRLQAELLARTYDIRIRNLLLDDQRLVWEYTAFAQEQQREAQRSNR